MSENLARQLELLPGYFGWHVVICAIAMGVGLAISLPLGVIAARRPRLGAAMLAIASVVQTVPSIALLALTYALLVGIRNLLPPEAQFTALGFWPTIIALTLYSILPMLRNTVTGLRGIDPALIEAARGIGMTDRQRLLRVELPLAMPVIIAGIRTSTVWTVGIATLSTPIGQVSLGSDFFGGLQTFNIPAVIFGCVAAAVLAIALDMLIAVLERAARLRSVKAAGVAVVVLAMIFIAGIAGVTSGNRPLDGQGRRIVIAAKNFNEQFILAELLDRRLSEAGYATHRIEGLGTLNVFNALVSGEIDVYVDYSGTIWTGPMEQPTGPTRDEMLAGVTEWLMDHHGIINLGSLGFENTYALVMRRDDAEADGIRTIADLAGRSTERVLGGAVEFFDRPEWKQLQEKYALDFKQRVPMNPTLMYQAITAGEVDVICAFSSDGRIAAFDLTVLDDTRSAFPPYDAMVLVSRRAAEDPALLNVLRPLIGSIDLERMQQANQRVDVDGQTPAQAAEWLDEQLRR